MFLSTPLSALLPFVLKECPFFVESSSFLVFKEDNIVLTVPSPSSRSLASSCLPVSLTILRKHLKTSIFEKLAVFPTMKYPVWIRFINFLLRANSGYNGNFKLHFDFGSELYCLNNRHNHRLSNADFAANHDFFWNSSAYGSCHRKVFHGGSWNRQRHKILNEEHDSSQVCYPICCSRNSGGCFWGAFPEKDRRRFSEDIDGNPDDDYLCSPYI